MKKLSSWIDVDLKKIRNLMNEGISCQKIARMEGVPITVLYEIRDGVDVKRFYRQEDNHKQLEGFSTLCKRKSIAGMASVFLHDMFQDC